MLAILFTAISTGWIVESRDNGWTLYSGDGLAHLNIARRVFDSRTPGLEQLGSVWLPLPHLAMIPFVRVDSLWQSAVAGAIPAGFCYVSGCLLFFGAVRRLFDSVSAGVVAALVLGVNSNLLFLQASPMTEPFATAGLAALFYCVVRFRQSRELFWAAMAGIAATAGELCRYELWAAAAAGFVWIVAMDRRRWRTAVLYGSLAALGPLLWFGFNRFYFGDPLEFYHGPYSARALYQRALENGMSPYPGDGHWLAALRYYLAAVKLSIGWPALVVALAGLGAAMRLRQFGALALVSAPILIVLASVFGGATPIFVPDLWPNAWYNIRYGLSALPLAALGAGAVVTVSPAAWRSRTSILVTVSAAFLWIWFPVPADWACWQEASHNSMARRQWAAEAASYLKPRYREGEGVLAAFGTLTPIFPRAGIPLRETVHSGNHPLWLRIFARPDLFLNERWIVCMSDDEVSRLVDHMQGRRLSDPAYQPRYDLVKEILVSGAPAVRIFRRR